MEVRNFKYERDHKVHDCADWRIVVQRYEWVHFHVGKNLLDEYESRSFEAGGGHLAQEPGKDELDLSKRCNDDTENDEGYIEKSVKIERLQLKRPRDE
jgi:hypothetical protein